jgi:hypothetical protein
MVAATPIRIVELTSTARQDVPGGVDLEIASDAPFEVGDQAHVLEVGGVRVKLSQLPDPGDLRRLTFTFTAEQFASLKGGEPMVVRYGSAAEWQLGPLDKTLLPP